MVVIIRFIFKIFTGCFHDRFQFTLSNNREHSCEHKKTSEEKSYGPNIDTYFDPSGSIHAPAGWKVIAVNGSNDDHKTLEPHSDIYDDGKNEGSDKVSTDLFEPEQLGGNHIACHHAPVRPPVRTGKTINESIGFIFNA